MFFISFIYHGVSADSHMTVQEPYAESLLLFISTLTANPAMTIFTVHQVRLFPSLSAQLAGAVEYTDCISADE